MDINLNIINVLRFAMELVEASSAKGEEQKTCWKTCKASSVDAPITDTKEKMLLDMIDEGILGDMATLVVSATKGELNINVAVEVAGVCCKSCFGSVLKK